LKLRCGKNDIRIQEDFHRHFLSRLVFKDVGDSRIILLIEFSDAFL